MLLTLAQLFYVAISILCTFEISTVVQEYILCLAAIGYCGHALLMIIVLVVAVDIVFRVHRTFDKVPPDRLCEDEILRGAE